MKKIESPRKKFITTLFNSGDRIAYCEIHKNNKVSDNRIISRQELLKMEWPVGASIGINPVKEGVARRSNKNVQATRTILIDVDGKNLPSVETFKALPIKPSFVFSRDKTHHHIYFLLRAPKTRTDKTDKIYKEITKTLITKLGGDRAVKDPARMVRLPMCPHPSGGSYKPTKQIIDYGPRYGFQKIAKLVLGANSLPLPGQNNTRKSANSVTDKGDIDPINDKKNAPDDIIELIKTHYLRGNKVTAGAGRSTLLLHVGFDCHAWGLIAKDALALGEEINQTTCSPPENFEILKHQIKSAYQYATQEFGYLLESTGGEAEKGKRKIYNRFKDSQKVRSKLVRFVYVTAAERLLCLDSQMELTTKGQIENYVAHKTGVRRTIVSLLSESLVSVCDYIDFIPDNPERIIERTNPAGGLEKIYNRYEAISTLQTGAINSSAVTVFTKHIKYLTTGPEEYKAVLNYFAFIIQNPGGKLPYALLVISQKQGVGKSLLEKLFRNILSTTSGREYVGSIENDELTQQWTEYLRDRLICFVHELAQKDRYNTMNKLKNMITEDHITIHGKYARPYTIKNTTNLIMFSNKENAIKIDKEDRRLLVIYNNVAPKTGDYYKKLANCFDENAGDIYRYLFHKVDLKNFNCFERPILTRGKKQLIEQGESELDIYLDELKRENRGPISETLFSPSEILDYVRMFRPDLKPSVKSVRGYLIERDWESIQIDVHNKTIRLNRKLYGSKKVIEGLKRGGKPLFDKHLQKYLARIGETKTAITSGKGAEGV